MPLAGTGADQVRELFREHPFAMGERMFDQQLNRLWNQPLALGRLWFG
jgi:hypothetical protein